MKKEYVRKQHYIPQYALKAFQTGKKGIPFINLHHEPIKLRYSQSRDLMQEKDFYEIKNEDGNYIFRNYIEDSYAILENKISSDFNKFVTLSLNNNFQEEFKKMVDTGEWFSIEASLLLHIISTMVRGIGIKHIFKEKSDLPTNFKKLYYLMFTTSKEVATQFANEIFCKDELELALHIIKEDELGSPQSLLSHHIFENYQIRVCSTEEGKELFLSDNPVIVQKFEGEDYIFPISPNICLILVPLNVKGDNIMVNPNIYPLTSKQVDSINEESILNTERLLIVSSNVDIGFIENVMKRHLK